MEVPGKCPAAGRTFAPLVGWTLACEPGIVEVAACAVPGNAVTAMPRLRAAAKAAFSRRAPPAPRASTLLDRYI